MIESVGILMVKSRCGSEAHSLSSVCTSSCLSLAVSVCSESGVSSAHLRSAEMCRSASGVTRLPHDDVVPTSSVAGVECGPGSLGQTPVAVEY